MSIDRPDLAAVCDLTIDGIHHHHNAGVVRLLVHGGTAVWHDHPPQTS